METKHPIVSGLGDIVPPSVLKGTGNRYAIASKSAEFITNKLAMYKYLDKTNLATRNQFIHGYCSYLPKQGRITRHELIYKILEHVDAYNNFRRIGLQYRNLHDIANFAINKGIDKKYLLVPSFGENIVYQFSDPMNLTQYEEGVIDTCRKIETFLETTFAQLKSKGVVRA